MRFVYVSSGASPSDDEASLTAALASAFSCVSNTPALAQIATAFLATLVPVSAGADLLARGIGLSFDGAASRPAVRGISRNGRYGIFGRESRRITPP